jgi:protein involved in polysaccharide export with SLBB domain
MRTRCATIVLIVLMLTSLGRSADPQKQEPQWKEAGELVVVFGDVERAGFYTITNPISLSQLVASAGLSGDKKLSVTLHRPAGNGAKSITIDAARLREDGDIPLQANDVIKVTTRKERQ